MATIQRFEDFDCWKTGRMLKRAIYRFTRQRPFAADFALVDQIRRAAQSVTSNIAEGFEREGNKEFIQFLSYSKGSVGEVKDQLYTALDECYITQKDFDRTYALADETTRMIGGLTAYLRRTELTGSKFKRSPASMSPSGPATPVRSKPRTPNSKP
ncbi:S23 ribosomal protein [Opitutaceae bacterium TAV1]|nr:S23 ribosomal protein [Opitutaceae bacterium TAV1]